MTAPVARCALAHARRTFCSRTDVGVSDPFGDIARHARSEFVDGISADVVRVRAFEVETGARNDFQRGLFRDAAQPWRVAAHIGDAVGGEVATARHLDQAVPSGVGELADLCQRQVLIVADPEVVTNHDRVAVYYAEDPHLHPGVRVYCDGRKARSLFRVLLPYCEVAEDVLMHGRRTQLVRVHISGHGSDNRHRTTFEKCPAAARPALLRLPQQRDSDAPLALWSC